MGPTDFAKYLTVEEAVENHIDMHMKNPDIDCSIPADRVILTEHYTTLAKATGTCETCGLPIWRYAGMGMCFPCTTGEADASDDYELEQL
jgi:hypothetical protein